ncbi:MAG: c-type cytochrome [Lentisphaeraceae bacterium]|nr:c-type cytochrome [Lentisphaeraceae bacterium]
MKYLFYSVVIALFLTQVTNAVSTDPSRFKVKDGFKVELLYTVPRDQQGSWVAMTTDPQGRLIVSDQYGALYRLTVPVAGQKGDVKVEKIELKIGSAQGLLYAFDGLYVMVNGSKKLGKGVFKVTDKDGDDKYDTVTELLKFEDRGGEHGPHALVLSPDKKSIYMVVGNQTALPKYQSTRVPPLWGEDQLLPRVYGKGFMKGTHAPKGFIAKCTPDFKNVEIISTGFRNQYDAAFNREGELFTFDADMEWDLNTPWYRPTRVNHVVSGAEFGWRNGSAKFMNYYPDNLPTTIDIGPGSPTGVTFGYGAAFPKKYQNAFFICDWSYGKMYAVHLKPDGATYTGEFEEFIAGQPLPLTDILIHPKDNAMYFTTGGRKVQSALYRVTYNGSEKVLPSKAAEITAEAKIRHELEQYHAPGKSEAIAKAWPYLSHKDRHVRYAARTAIEHQDSKTWSAKALSETNPQASIEALLALSRAGEKSNKDAIISQLLKLDWNALSTEQKLAQLRTLELTLIRMDGASDTQKQALIKAFDSKFPTSNADLNKELCQTLVYLGSETVVAKSVELLITVPSQEEQIHYAKSLRLAKKGWNEELYRKVFNWFAISGSYGGGASFKIFIDEIKKDTVSLLSDEEKKKLADAINAKPKDINTRSNPALELISKRGFYKNWTVADFKGKLSGELKGRNFENGKNFFGAANCTSCHRIGEYGGIIGPDLTGSGGRFAPLDLLEAIIEPSKQISDQYNSVNLNMKDGSVVNGRIANLSGDSLRIITNLYNPGKMTSINRGDIKSIEDAKISMMPPGLINLMKDEEVLDLLAYILSRGDKNNAMFKK